MIQVIRFSIIVVALVLASGCATTQKYWKAARLENSVEAYENFAAKYPNGPYADSVRLAIERLHYNMARKSNTLDSYGAFLSSYRDGVLADSARLAIERLDYKDAEVTNTVESYEAFLAVHPKGSFADNARLAIERLHYAKAKTSGAAESYKAFLEAHPDGSLADSAKLAVERLRIEKAQAASAASSYRRYTDPKEFFSIVPPAGWRVQDYPQDSRGKVAFLAPASNVDLRVLVNAVDFGTVDELVAHCKRMEARLGFSTNIERVDFEGWPAVKRSFKAKGIKFMYIDLLVGKVDHNLAFVAPEGLFGKYQSVALSSMRTYEPVMRNVTNKDVVAHAVAKKLRLAQLAKENGNVALALAYVDEGLELAPGDAGLLALRNQLGH